MSTDEQERLKRLRDRQLNVRDPLIKQRQFQKSSSIKEKRMQKPFSLTKAWAEIPHIIKMPFYGLTLGILIMLILPNFWASPWAILVSGGLIVFFLVLGVIIGNALDIRDNIRDHIK